MKEGLRKRKITKVRKEGSKGYWIKEKQMAGEENKKEG